ncbi:hypothetical protein TeGR_g5679 [Tetraparma gracilis]|uniref:Uncharacterized protein n=1 Tax=Tetraparma gracilis TaxID=2962635 RepID=A0ABQ6N9M8_9STRA|nr:hypothetical protein TeGR_g5679 [Tetraparma gracilis]
MADIQAQLSLVGDYIAQAWNLLRAQKLPEDLPERSLGNSGEELTHEQYIAYELRRKLEEGEELSHDFCVECAKVLGVDSDQVRSAFGPDIVADRPKENRGQVRHGDEGEDDMIYIPEVASESSSVPRGTTVAGSPLATDWVKDLLPDGQENPIVSSLLRSSVPSLTTNGSDVSWEDFTGEHVIECIDCFNSASTTEREKIAGMIKLAKIVETTEDGSDLGRRERHENQVRLLNAMIENDGLNAIHEIQAGFADKQIRQLAAHLLAKIASKIYEGWN